jgi:glycogen operon protein
VTWLNQSGWWRTASGAGGRRKRDPGLRLTKDSPDAEGMKDVLILFNPHDDGVAFRLPKSFGNAGSSN